MLTSEVKSALKATVRELRDQLLRDLSNHLERVYRLGVRLNDAALEDAPRERRQRLEAWIEERARATGATKKADLDRERARFRDAAVKEAAYTLLNRVIVLRILEEDGHIKPPVVKGGWQSKAYREFIQ